MPPGSVEPTRRPQFSGLGLAVRLVIVDRWPTVITRSVLWDRLRFDDAFAYRWWEWPLPDASKRWFRRGASVATSPMTRRARSLVNTHLARRRIARGCRIEDVNRGPGDRGSNALHVALAVDAHLDGATASALPRREPGDPVHWTDMATALGVRTHAEIANSVDALERLVDAWGPGAKGIVSVRDPDGLFLRVLNVVNDGGQHRYLDHAHQIPPPRASRSRIGRAAGRPDDPEASARRILDTIDTRAAFASIRTWRTADLPGAGRLARGVHRLGAEHLDLALAAALPLGVSATSRRILANRIRFMADDAYTGWLCEQVWRGACTLMPGEIADLAAAPSASMALPPVITRLDEALVRLIARGVGGLHGPRLALWVPDDEQTATDVACFPAARIWRTAADGMTAGTIEITIDPTDLRRVTETDPHFVAPDGMAPRMAAPVVPRQTSWLDVNSAPDRTGRKTNCWNCVAATANWLEKGAPSSSLPIYRAAPLRTTIPEFLAQLGALGRPVYVDDGAAADLAVAAWGRERHGIVVAALSRESTHIFNAYTDAGGRVRYLDSYVALEGDYNFDSDWQKIGVVELGPVHPQILGHPARDRVPVA